MERRGARAPALGSVARVQRGHAPRARLCARSGAPSALRARLPARSQCRSAARARPRARAPPRPLLGGPAARARPPPPPHPSRAPSRRRERRAAPSPAAPCALRAHALRPPRACSALTNSPRTSLAARQVVDSFELVEKLTELGVSATDVKKLKEAGIYTVEALFMRPRKARRPVAARSHQRLLRQSAGCPAAPRAARLPRARTRAPGTRGRARAAARAAAPPRLVGSARRPDAACDARASPRRRLTAALQELIAIKGLSEAKVDKIVDAAGKARGCVACAELGTRAAGGGGGARGSSPLRRCG
jgi:hypothetical protein